MRISALPVAFFLLFVCVAIIVSYWVGGFYWNGLAVGAVSLAACLLLRNALKDFDLDIPAAALFFACIAGLLALYPVLFVTPGYLGSADSMHIVHVRLLGERAPVDYQPYSPLGLHYFLGFTFIGKMFVGLFPFMFDNFALALLGGLMVAVQSILVFLIAKHLGGSDDAGILASLLFTGTKYAFQNMYLGLFPELLGTALFLFLIIAILKGGPLKFIAFPAMVFTHVTPLMFLGFAAFFSLVFLRPALPERKEMLFWGFALLLAAPVFPTYHAFLVDGISMNSGNLLAPPENPLDPASLLTAALFLGLGPFVVFSLCFALWLSKPALRNRPGMLCLLGIFFSGVLVYLLLRNSTALFYKTVELAGLSAIMFSALWLARQDYFPAARLAAYRGPLLAALLAFMLAGFFSSGVLHSLAQGSKITPSEAAFSFEFRKAVPERAATLFVSKGSTPMAALSDKIPYNVLDGFFVSLVGKSFDPAYPAEQKKSGLQKQIVSGRCASCIGEADIKYIAAPKGFFSGPLPYPIVFEYGGYQVYEKPPPAQQPQIAGG